MCVQFTRTNMKSATVKLIFVGEIREKRRETGRIGEGMLEFRRKFEKYARKKEGNKCVRRRVSKRQKKTRAS